MFAKHPLDAAKEKLEKGDIVDAVRLAMIAEIDAVSFYLQVAQRAEDPAVRKVFEDIAREEMAHLGEFTSLLYRLDPSHRAEAEKGFEEVRELLGGGGEAALPARQGGGAGDPPTGQEQGLEAEVASLFRRDAERLRLLRRSLPVTTVGAGVDFVPVESVAYSGSAVAVEAESVLPLREVAIEFLIPQRLVERSSRLGGRDYAPLVAQAARRLVTAEERLILDSLLGLEGSLEANMGTWERPGEAVDDVARAIARMEAEGITGPYVLIVSPQRYTKLLAVHEKTGVMELARLEKLAKVLRHPLLTNDRAILVPADSSVLDIVVGVDTRVDHVGPEAGAQRFRAWETLALRVHYPRGVTTLSQS